MEQYRSRIARVGQKTQLVADIYPLPTCKYKYVWSVLRGGNIAKVDSKGVLTISRKARPGDSFTIKTTAVAEDPFITPKATIVDYLVQ